MFPGPSSNEMESRTILVVDDEEPARRLICLILRQGGYHVLEAADSDSAAKMHRSHQQEIGLLLTDVHLPGRNGCELAAMLRNNRPDLRVLFMSGLPWAELPDCGVPEGGWSFLQKPFGIKDLLSGVQSFLGTAPA